MLDFEATDSVIGARVLNLSLAKVPDADTIAEVALDLALGFYSDHGNRKVRRGIRPEDLVLADSNRSLTVKLVEQLGADKLVHGYFGAGQTDMTIRLPGIQHYKQGEILAIHAEPEKIHPFDPDTGRRLE